MNKQEFFDKMHKVIAVGESINVLADVLSISEGLVIPYFFLPHESGVNFGVLRNEIIETWWRAFNTWEHNLPVGGLQRGLVSVYKGGCDHNKCDDAFNAGINPIRRTLTGPCLWGTRIWFDGKFVERETSNGKVIVGTQADIDTLYHYGIISLPEPSVVEKQPFSVSKWWADRKFRKLYPRAFDPREQLPDDKKWYAVFDPDNEHYPVWLASYDKKKNCFFAAGGWFECDEISLCAELHPLTNEVFKK